MFGDNYRHMDIWEDLDRLSQDLDELVVKMKKTGDKNITSFIPEISNCSSVVKMVKNQFSNLDTIKED